MHTTRVALRLATAALLIATPVLAPSARAQDSRFGRWKLKSDAPAPASNIMTYEPNGTGGMKVTVTSVNARSDTTSWWYLTEFDGRDMPVTGSAGTTHTSVRRLDAWTNEIINKRNGRITQVLTNVLSRDGNTIGVIYMRDDGMGHTTNVSFATYERIRP
jgi:hypothetical protein